MAVNPQGTLIASVSRDTTVRVWNNNASANCSVMNGHSAPVKSIDFNQDGNLDAATANYRAESVSVLAGQGDGTFQPAVTTRRGLRSFNGKWHPH